jgi:hypothetical protein
LLALCHAAVGQKRRTSRASQLGTSHLVFGLRFTDRGTPTVEYIGRDWPVGLDSTCFFRLALTTFSLLAYVFFRMFRSLSVRTAC